MQSIFFLIVKYIRRQSILDNLRLFLFDGSPCLVTVISSDTLQQTLGTLLLPIDCISYGRILESAVLKLPHKPDPQE